MSETLLRNHYFSPRNHSVRHNVVYCFIIIVSPLTDPISVISDSSAFPFYEMRKCVAVCSYTIMPDQSMK